MQGDCHHPGTLQNLFCILCKWCQLIIEHAHEVKLDDMLVEYKKFDKIPFDFNRRRMSVAVQGISGGIELITKGAIAEMLVISTKPTATACLWGKRLPVLCEPALA